MRERGGNGRGNLYQNVAPQSILSFLKRAGTILSAYMSLKYSSPPFCILHNYIASIAR